MYDATNNISLYLHCKKCLEELPEEVSPSEYSNTQAGWTKKAIQVWCNRHDIDIINLDFDGQKVAYATDNVIPINVDKGA